MSLSEGSHMQSKPRSQGCGGSFSAACAAVLLAILGAADVGAAPVGPGPLRDLWSRGSERFVRTWLLLGPVSASSADLDVNALQPAPGAAQSLSGGATSKWTPYTGYHDTVDLVGVSQGPVSRGRQAAPTVTYADTTIIRAQDR